MRYEYFKIIDPAFVQSLLDGNLYMNSLNYFRALEEGTQKEGNKAQKDPMEGICGTIPKTASGRLVFISARIYWKLWAIMCRCSVKITDTITFLSLPTSD